MYKERTITIPDQLVEDLEDLKEWQKKATCKLVEELQAKGMTNALVFVYLHELGHSLMREWGLPLWDNEDAADEFATAFLLMGNQKKIALDSAQWWQSEGATTQDAVAKIWMDDRHSLSPQRARNIIRWVNDANDITQRWEHVLVPHMQTAVLQSSLNDPAVPDKDFVRSVLSRRNVILPAGLSLGQSKCPNGQDIVGRSCAPMCWQDDCKVAIPCGSRVATEISITKPREACLKYQSALAANQGCWLGALIQERVCAGIRNARAKGKQLGRPRLTDTSKMSVTRWRRAAAVSQGNNSQIAASIRQEKHGASLDGVIH